MKREEIEARARLFCEKARITSDVTTGIMPDDKFAYSRAAIARILADGIQSAYTAGLERAAEIAEAEIDKYEHSPLVVGIGQRCALRRAVAKIRPEKNQD